jgi:mannan endo-1,4-beta-mannosidase
MWQMVNEAESPTHTHLYNFAADIAKLIKSIDSRHLVNLGTMGGGQAGTAGDDFRKLHAIPEIDICEYHDYSSPSATMPGDQWNGLKLRFDQCNALGKPLFIGEVGIRLDQVSGSTAERARLFEEKIKVQLAAGAVGYLPWAWMDNPKAGDYDIGPGDPTLGVLSRY